MASAMLQLFLQNFWGIYLPLFLVRDFLYFISQVKKTLVTVCVGADIRTFSLGNARPCYALH